MTDIPIVLVAHDDRTYSFGDTGERIVMERVTLDEITEYLEDRHERLLPAPSLTGDQLWDEYHPADEAPIDIPIDGPTFLTLSSNRETGRISVRRSDTDETLVSDVSAAQVFGALKPLAPD